MDGFALPVTYCVPRGVVGPSVATAMDDTAPQFVSAMRNQRAIVFADAAIKNRETPDEGKVTLRALLLLLLLAACLVTMLASPVAAQTVLVSNDAQGDTAATRVGIHQGGEDRRLAALFTTGPNSDGYHLSSVKIRTVATSGVSSVTVTIHATTAGTPNATATHTLNSPTLAANSHLTFTAPAGATLNANTTYAVVIAAAGASGRFLEISTTRNTSEDPGAAGSSGRMEHR